MVVTDQPGWPCADNSVTVQPGCAGSIGSLNTVVVAVPSGHCVGDTTFLAMELIEGRTLRSVIGEDVAIATRLGWLLDIAATLAFAHSRGFVHRDIKPENIMIRADGVLKVLDFGIARRARALPTAATLPADGARASQGTGAGNSTFAGTPHYMAPEQMFGQALDGRADQFAWGVVAYELLSGGTMPWPDASDLARSRIWSRSSPR